MLKKMANWTFGSIFRTFGRFLAYIVIGILISLLFFKKEYVKALSLDGTVDGRQYVFTNNSVMKEFYSTTDTQLINGWQFDSSINSGDSNYLVFTYTSFMKHWDQSSSSASYDNELGDFEFRAIITSSAGTTTFCEKQNNLIVCPVTTNTTYTWLNISMAIPQSQNNPPSHTSYFIAIYSQVYRVSHGGTEVEITSIPSSLWDYLNDLFVLIRGDNTNITSAIESQMQQSEQMHNETMNIITGEVNGTGTNGTITDSDAMANSCGIICKLKHLIQMFSIDNLKYIIIPTEEQMNDLFEQMQTKITSKIGILGLPVTVYTRLMQIAMQYQDTETNNWCINWNAVPVPNFEEYNIIQEGQFCFSDILANQKIDTFRNTCIYIIGGLILLSFLQYLYNCLHRILDVPVHEDYTYFTTEDVYNINTDTGEVVGHQVRSRQTRRGR